MPTRVVVEESSVTVCRSPADVPAAHEAVAAALAALVTTVHDGTTLST
ncbi:MAG TPA: hypothetical protein VGD48_19010 [Kutzneria sp.]